MSLKIEFTTPSHLAKPNFFEDWKLKCGLHYFDSEQIDKTYRPDWKAGTRGTARFVINEENLKTLNRLSARYEMKPTQILRAISNDMYFKQRKYCLPDEVCAPKELQHEPYYR